MKGRIKFPSDSDRIHPIQNRQFNGAPNLTLLNGVSVMEDSLRDGISRAVALTYDDFASAGLDPRTPLRYGSENAIRQRAEMWTSNTENQRRATAAYFLSQSMGIQKNVVGMVSYIERQNGVLRYVLPDNRRQVTGWINERSLDKSSPSTKNKSTEAFVVDSLKVAINVASASGIEHLELLVSKEHSMKNEDLIVVEHTIDPSEHGFRLSGHKASDVEGGRYEGELWVKKLA